MSQNDVNPIKTQLDSTAGGRRIASSLAALFVAAALFLLAGCSGPVSGAETNQLAGPGGETGDTAEIIEGRLVNIEAGADDVVDGVLDRLGIAGMDDPDVRAEILERLVPDGVDITDDAALAAALAGRLGPVFADVDDVDVLLEAVVAQLTADGEVTSADELLAAISAWANDGVILLGSASDGGPTIRLTSSFEDAVEVIESAGVAVDLVSGLVPIELRDVVVDVDDANRTIRIAAWVPAPLSGTASVSISWASGEPQLTLRLERDALRLADLVPNADLGELGAVGAADITLEVDPSGMSVQANLVPSSLPGLADLDLAKTALAVDFITEGLGPWSVAEMVEPMTIVIPLEPALLGSWNTARDATVTVTLASDPVIAYQETLVAEIGGQQLTFAGAAEVGQGDLAVALRMDGDWQQPFGAAWLTLSDVALSFTQTDGASTAVISGRYTLAGKTGTLSFELMNDGEGTQARVTGDLDDLDADDLVSVAQTLVGDNLLPDGISVPEGTLSLRSITVSFTTSPDGMSFAMNATTELFGQTVDAAFSIVPAAAGGPTTMVVLQPRDIVLGDLLPLLADNEMVGDLRLPDSAIVLTGEQIRTGVDALDPAVRGLLAGSMGGVEDIRLPAGISLTGTVPGGAAPAIDDLKELLGMNPASPLVLSGTIPADALTGGSGGEFVLEATLPAMSPDGSPEWFVSAELGFRITSQPSVGIFGALTLDIQDDIQTFEIEASIAKVSDGVAVEFVGRLANPWESPFDVEWLTLNQVVLKLAMAPGGVTIGFTGDIEIGSKDIAGTMATTISPAGAPTNFIFQAKSEEGVSLGDLADLYAFMTGEQRPPVEQVLPAVEIRDIELRFAPKGDADLGVEQGFAIKGELWMSQGIGGPLERIVGVDLEVSDRGIEADGYLTDFALGPVAFDETVVSLAVTTAEQRLAFSGGVTVAGSAVDITMAVSRTEMSFGTAVDFNGSRASLEISASYDLRNPSWSVTAVMNEQFIRDVDAATERLLGAKISDLNSQITTARAALDTAEDLLDVANAGLNEAKKVKRALGCGLFLKYVCDAVDSAAAKVAAESRKVTAANDKLKAAEKLLEEYDIQLTIVGAEFTAEFGALDSNKVSMSLMVDANGYRTPVPISWDFNKTIDANLDGLLDQVAAL